MSGQTIDSLRTMLQSPDREVFERGWAALEGLAAKDAEMMRQVIGENWEREGRYLFKDVPCVSFGPSWADRDWLENASGEIKIRLALRILRWTLRQGEDLSHVGRLVLTHGNLSELSEADTLADLPGLRSIRLTDNPLRRVPDCLRGLHALQCLDMKANELDRIPDWIGELEGLVYLHLQGDFADIPTSIGRLQQLETLCLGNGLQALPDEICHLRRLRKLDLSRNQALEYLPADLGRLNLECLDVSETVIRALPAGLKALKLRYSHLSKIWDDVGPQNELLHLDVMDSCHPGIVEKLAAFPALQTLKLEQTGTDSSAVVETIRSRYPSLNVEAGVSLGYFTQTMCDPWGFDDY